MDFLVFQLQAPLASWGDTAVGEYRGSYEYPGESALLGLLAAALGIRREEDLTLSGLRQGYGFAVGVQDGGTLLRDYHTAQVPGRAALRGDPRPAAHHGDSLPPPTHIPQRGPTRRDFVLHLGRTILSTRDYPRGVLAHSLIRLYCVWHACEGRAFFTWTKILSAGRACAQWSSEQFRRGSHSNRTSRGSNSCVQRFRINGDACHWRKSHP